MEQVTNDEKKSEKKKFAFVVRTQYIGVRYDNN